jgi:hypothetical protein
MLTLNEMLIFCFERHAVGECPTVVLYKYRKNIKIRKQYRSVKKRSRTIQQAIQPNRNAIASLNHKIIFQLKMLFSQTEILILSYASLNLKIIFQPKSGSSIIIF